MKQLSRALTALIVIALVSSVGSALRAGQASRVDVTGAWTFTVESPAGKSNPTITFKQDGEKLTGHYSSQLLGEVPLSGTVKGSAIEFSINANVQGTAVTLKYTGTIENKDSMKGTLSTGEFGDGTFTASRQ